MQEGAPAFVQMIAITAALAEHRRAALRCASAFSSAVVITRYCAAFSVCRSAEGVSASTRVTLETASGVRAR